MSLKAKMEAVIYASEEPVTLAQLVGLLGEEAQVELDAQVAQQAELALESRDPEALNDEVLDGVEEGVPQRLEPDGENGDEPSAEAVDHHSVADSEAADSQNDDGAGAGAEAGSGGEETAVDEKAAEKKAQREKERRLREYFRGLLDELIAEYASAERGLEIREVAGGFRMATKPEYHDAVRGFVKGLKPPLKLSLQALETLAVVAYKQPVTSPEVSEIRGVDSGGVLGGLMARKLVTTAGRKQVIGRPILYKTTKDFLVRFGLKDLGELPSIEEFEKMAGELADEPTQEEIPMADAEAHEPADGVDVDEVDAAPGAESPLEPSVDAAEADAQTAADLEPMAGVHEPQADGDSEDSV